MPLLKDDDNLIDKVLARKYPYIQNWLKNDYTLPESLMGKVNSLYRDNDKFYDNLEPTNVCKGFIQALELPGVISQLHIFTHNFDNHDPCIESKNRWIERYLGSSSKVIVHHLNAGEKKSHYMQQHCPNPSVFLDDSLKNVVDIITNDRVKPNEILIPKMGHNDDVVSSGIALLSTLRNIKLDYYTNVL
jgi:hypothetical protein